MRRRLREEHEGRGVIQKRERSSCRLSLLRAGRGLILFFMLITLSEKGSGQVDSAGVDTSEVMMPLVTVTSSRLSSREGNVGQASTFISRAQIESAGARDLADAVAFSPGLYVKRYGGLGGLRTLSLRGTASEGTAMLIDGVRYRSDAEGGFDLGNIPANVLEGVEVIRGGDAALLGGNSLGGGINLITGIKARNLRFEGTLALGSFGERSLSGGGSGSVGEHLFDGSLHLTRSEGDYPFQFNEFGESLEIKRENGDFSNLFARAGWKFRPEEGGWELGSTLQGYRTERGVPGGVVQGNRERLRARLDEEDIFGLFRFSRTFGRVKVSLASTGRINELRYRDPDDRTGGLDGVDNRYRLIDGRGTARLAWFPDNRTTLGADLEVEAIGLNGDNLDPAVADGVGRQRLGGLVRGSRMIPFQENGTFLSLNSALRYDLFSDLDPELVPSFGFLLQPFSYPFRLRAHAALNYRAPTFSEQYYLNFGNADLQTEHSKSLSTGWTWEPVEGISLESSLFLIDTRNRIVAIPRSPVSWSAQNLGRVRSRGVEVGLNGTFVEETLSGALSYTRMEAIDRSGGITDGHLLPYAPQELFNGLLRLDAWKFSLIGSWDYVSHRHTLSFNTAESALPHYLVLNLGLSRDVSMGTFWVSGRLDVNNLLDESYQVVRNYPMPGRSVRGEMKVVWGK